MALVEARTWMELIAPERCWQLLRGREVGRIAVVGPEGPEIFPINYAVENRTVVFRSDPGTKLAAIEHHPEVAFETDGLDELLHIGWSVVLKGAVRTLGPDEVATARQLPLRPWTLGGDKARWFRIEPRSVSGRAIHERRN